MSPLVLMVATFATFLPAAAVSSCEPCKCTECPMCPTCAPPLGPCPPTPPPCETIPPTRPPAPTCPAAPLCALPPAPGDVADSTLMDKVEDITDPCMLVISPNKEGFLVKLLGLFGVGRSIAIRGNVQPEADIVTFQLRTAKGTAMNLGFRVNGQDTARNSKLGGFWDVEEETEADPLPIGRHFEVIIRSDVDRFRVTVGGVHQEDFAYQGFHPRNFMALTSQRDVSLMDVKLI
ncbi:uncharacterized protein LOC130917160 [Corythoichthys intestinalis]|uniref:uncharacterized protein LOC130917160 n=1 Tax=Corythoichthys intestinalis TaxID=161448 RepID=UPI0025A4EBD4|nr:uncharacterized protein LOC130917160 [Corythoichthys intestinalis]